MSREYEPNEIQLSFWTNVHDFFAGFSDRKDLLKRFCHENNIEYPVDTSKHHHFPDGYLIKTDEISYLSKLRDKIIIEQFESYKKCQNDIKQLLTSLNGKLEYEESVLPILKKEREQIVGKLSVEKDTTNKIFFEDERNKKDASIKNCMSNIDTIKADIQAEEDKYKENRKSWHKEVDYIEKVIDLQAKKYITNATKKIRRKLNYTIFSHVLDDYSDSVKELMEGEFQND